MRERAPREKPPHWFSYDELISLVFVLLAIAGAVAIVVIVAKAIMDSSP